MHIPVPNEATGVEMVDEERSRTEVEEGTGIWVPVVFGRVKLRLHRSPLQQQ